MHFLGSILFIVLFIILMIVVFSMGMLIKLVERKEIILVIISSFIIGSLGGMFFLYPVYEELPSFVSTMEAINFNNEETLYLDVSSIKLENLEKNLTQTKGVNSFKVTGITFNLWRLTDSEMESIDSRLGNVNPNYTSWEVTKSGNVHIEIENGSDPNKALKSFSDWFKYSYGETITYGQVHIVLEVQSSEVQNVKDYLLDQNIVPVDSSGPVEDSIEKTKSSMLSYNEFVIGVGIFSILISVLGIYFDTIVVTYRKLNRFLHKKFNR
ncbi:hypothetical protein [Methanobrevibacter sp. DSM 116169]|uniref:hypothetical protein n=1 Tax=Methanobrevibacter sp. DSM 116169 TaxID=3242727 RepID=UPI0038FCFBE6